MLLCLRRRNRPGGARKQTANRPRVCPREVTWLRGVAQAPSCRARGSCPGAPAGARRAPLPCGRAPASDFFAGGSGRVEQSPHPRAAGYSQWLHGSPRQRAGSAPAAPTPSAPKSGQASAKRGPPASKPEGAPGPPASTAAGEQVPGHTGIATVSWRTPSSVCAWFVLLAVQHGRVPRWSRPTVWKLRRLRRRANPHERLSAWVARQGCYKVADALRFGVWPANYDVGSA